MAELSAYGPGAAVGDHWCLSEVDVFGDLSASEMAAIGARTPARTVETDQIVYSPQRRAEALYIVKRGRVRLFRIGVDGRTVTTAVASPGTIFGEMQLLGLRMGATWAQALEPSVLCLMSREDVRRLLLSDPRIATRVAEQLGARLAELEDRLADVVCKTLTERTATALRQLLGPRLSADQVEPIRLTHEQLAQLVGTSRERMTKALGELAERGLIQLKRGRILVRAPVGLAAYADGAARTNPDVDAL